MSRLLKLLCMTDEAVQTSEKGHPLTITANSNRYLNDYTIYGNSVQEGAPSPDTPIEVQSVGDLVTEGKYAGSYKIPVTVTCGDTVKTTDIYLNAPLRKIGDYADYVDFKGKRVVRRVKEIVLTGNEAWSTQGGGYENDTTCFFATATSTYKDRHTENISWGANYELCNMFQRNGWHLSSATMTSERFIFHYTEASKGFAYFRINKSRLAGNTADDFNAWLKGLYDNGTPLKLYYALENPVYEDADLPKLLQFKGESTYTVETDVTPSGLQVKYY